MTATTLTARNTANHTPRARERINTHTLAELKKYKWLPFVSTYSGVILDISLSGIKLAFSGAVDIKPHTVYTLKIPLIPLGLTHLKCFECAVEVKWFDKHNYRLGGLFIHLNEPQTELLNQIITALKAGRRT